MIAAANAEEEALAIAVALREALEHGSKTAALVTPDRALARRVLAALERWQVAVDDSGGDALADTPAGVFARLAAEAALDGLEPVTLLALLKHPLLRLGAGADAHARAIAALEQAVLRGPRPKPGSAGLSHALKTFRDNRREAASRRSARAADARQCRTPPTWSRRLADGAGAARSARRGQGSRSPLLPSAHRAGHRRAAQERRGDGAAFAGHDGSALGERVRGHRRQRAGRRRGRRRRTIPTCSAPSSPKASVRRPDRPGVRVRIYGLLEARLQSIDRVVLGGLVEGVWPPETRSDPWLSRPMRRALGLDLPERRISLIGARLRADAGRAARSCSPIPPSSRARRPCRRASCSGWRRSPARRDGTAALARGAHYLALGARARPARGKPQPVQAARAEARRAPRGRRRCRSPRSRPGCAIPIRSTPGTSCGCSRSMRSTRRPARATAAPSSMARSADFTAQFKDALPDDPVAELIGLGEEEFAALEDFPEAKAFWWPRYLRIARWFAEFEAQRRANVTAISAEIGASSRFRSATATLHAAHARRPHRASARRQLRHPRLQDRPAADSRSRCRPGWRRSSRSKARSCAPGKFEGIPAGGSIAEFLYVALRGGEPPGEPKPIDFKDSTPDAKSDEALAKLTTLVDEIRGRGDGLPVEGTADVHAPRRGDYDHLARVQGMVAHRRRSRGRSGTSNERAAPIPDAGRCRRQQRTASDPAFRPGSSANAGSGKTYVLAQRVIRLLLDGTDPSKILCLTFTKAAAANMANRVFERARALDHARRRGARRGDPATGSSASTPAARAGAAAVRRGAGDAGRPEGADHPRLLHAAAAPVPVRGQCRRALPGAGRDAAEADARRRSAWTSCSQAAAEPDSAAGRALAPSLRWPADFAFQLALPKRSASATRDGLARPAPAASSAPWRNSRRRSASSRRTRSRGRTRPVRRRRISPVANGRR